MSLREKHILLVDDEDAVRAALGSLLEREGYRVHSAEGGEEGLQILTREPIQLVISDYSMPQMNGVDFLKLVRERHPHVVRIMLTGDPNPEVIIRSVNEGEVYRFIRKPWDKTSLRVTLYFAFETIQLEEENRRLLAALRRQMNFIRGLEHDFPYLAALTRDEEAAMLLAEADLRATPAAEAEPAVAPRRPGGSGGGTGSRGE
jgi:DNA-binding NtrC family response regulator